MQEDGDEGGKSGSISYVGPFKGNDRQDSETGKDALGVEVVVDVGKANINKLWMVLVFFSCLEGFHCVCVIELRVKIIENLSKKMLYIVELFYCK